MKRLGGIASGENSGPARLAFRSPSPALVPLVDCFYLFRSDAPLVEGVERVDLGQLRFLLKGEGRMRFASGKEAPSAPAMLTAPGAAAAGYWGEGPFRCFGVSLRALGWRALTGLHARRSAETVIDAASIYGPDVLKLLDRLRAMETIDGMVAVVEPFLLRHVKPVPETHRALVEAVLDWEASEQPSIGALYQRVGMSERQVTRLLNEYFGGPPKHLERKIRAIRAAIAILQGSDPAEVADRFYDQAHMIRELRQFIGHTPRSLREGIDPVLTETLLRDDVHRLRAFPPK